MGNKSPHLEDGRREIGTEGPPISLMAQSNGCFGIRGAWRHTAILSVLESLFHIPCLCECILAADIDATCQRADRSAILELQVLFDARAKATSGSIVPADQFLLSLTASQLEGGTNDFDFDDPGQVYDAISSLIITTLPELRGIFLRDKHLKELAPSSKDAAGICITIPHKPDATLILETVIRDRFLAKSKIQQSSPVFVVTTVYTIPCGTSKSSVLFPPVLSMSSEASSNGIMYNLQSVIVQSESDPLHVKSFYLSANNSNWYESGMQTNPISTLDILNLGSPESPFRTRVLIYIHMDLSMKISTGFRFQTQSDNSTKVTATIHSSNGSDDVRVTVDERPHFHEHRHHVTFEDKMNEDVDSEDFASEEQEDNEEYHEEFGEEEYVEDEDDDEDEYEEEDEDNSAVCQCQTCRRDREMKLEAERTRLEMEAIERVKREKARRQLILRTPGTRSVPFQKVQLDRDEKEFVEGKYVFKSMYLQTITAMDGYNSKSLDELRFEDYCNDNSSLKEVKKKLDSEILDRIREATTRVAMEKEEKSMRIWSKAFDKAYKKYQLAMSHYNKISDDYDRDQVTDLFTQSLKLCLTGPHSADCYYYRALCNYPRNINIVIDDCENLLKLKPKHALGNYLLGSTLLKYQKNNKFEYELAEYYLNQAYILDKSIFLSDNKKIYEKVRSQFLANIQRRINIAEEKKSFGNKAMSKGKYKEAEELYTEAINLCPYNDTSHIYYSNRAAARCEMAVKNESNLEYTCEMLLNSIQDCDKCLLLQSDYPKAIFRKNFCLGLYNFYKENFEVSLQYFNSALELDPTNTIVKQEIRKVNTAIDVIKAKEKALEIEREIAAREALRAEEKEKERRLLAEKRAKEEQLRKEKADKIEKEKAERARIKSERDQSKAEKERLLQQEKQKEIERSKLEKEKEKQLREQLKAEERERKRLEKEKERERLRLEKEKQEKEMLELAEKERQRKEQFAQEMNRVKAVLNGQNASSSQKSSAPVTPVVTNPVEAVSPVLSAKNGEETNNEEKDVSLFSVPITSAPSNNNKPRSNISNPLSSIAMIAKTIASSNSSKSGTTGSTIKPNTVAPVVSNVVEKVSSTAIVVRYMDCPPPKVGLVIGAKGTIINEMMKRTGCKMCINQDYPDGHPRKVVFTGTQDQIEEAKVLVAAVIVHGPNVLSSEELIEEVSVIVKNGTFNPMATSWNLPSLKAQSLDSATGVTTSNDNILSSSSMDSNHSNCLTCHSYSKQYDKLLCIGSCNHIELCSICCLRRRYLDKDLSCLTCSITLDEMICSPSITMNSKYSELAHVLKSTDYIKHKESNIIFSKLYYNNISVKLFVITCHECLDTFHDIESLKQHYYNNHNLFLCMVCANSNHMYPIDIPTFSSQSELDLHITSETKNNEIHPLCQYCKDRHYDKSDLLVHISKTHVTCSICIRDSFIPKFFKDDKMLNEHLRKDHFACDEIVCQEKGNVAFKSLFELQAHKRNVHSDTVNTITSPIINNTKPPITNSLIGSLDNIFASSTSTNNILNDTSINTSNNKNYNNTNDNFFLPIFSYDNKDKVDNDLLQIPLTRIPSNLPSLPSLPNDSFNTSLNILGNDMIYESNWNKNDNSILGFSSSVINNSISGSLGTSLNNPIGSGLSGSMVGLSNNPNNYDITLNQSQSQLFNNIFDDDKSQYLQSNLSTNLSNNLTSNLTSNLSTTIPGFSLASTLPITRTPPPIAQSSDPLLLSSLGNSNSFANSILGYNTSLDSNKSLSSMPWMPISQSSSFGYMDNSTIDSYDLNKSSNLGVGNIDPLQPLVGLPVPIPSLSKSVSLSQPILDPSLDSNLYSQSSGLWGSKSPGKSLSSNLTPRVNDESAILNGIDSFTTSRSYGFLGRSLSDTSALTSAIPSSNHDSDSKKASSILPLNRGVTAPVNNNDDTDILSPSIFDLGIGTFSLNGRGGKLPPEFIPSNYNPQPSNTSSTTYVPTSNNVVKQSYSNIGSTDTGLSVPSLINLNMNTTMFSSVSSLNNTSSGNSYATSDHWNDDSSSNDGTGTFNSSYDRSLVPKALMDKLIEVLRRHPEGILGSQYPEAYRKIYNEKLVLETSNGRKLKLLNVLDGHPNVRKEKSGTWKWFYQENNGQNDSIDDIPTEFYPETMDDSTYKGDSGIEVDRLTADTFPSVAWLREYNIHMYQWAGNAFEWTEYAMRLSPEIEYLFVGENHPDNISKLTNCNISIQTEKLYNKEEKFLVFVRGPNGHPSNANMANALDYVSEIIKNEFYENGLLTGDFNNQPIGLYNNNINDNRIQRILEIPQHNVGLIAGKGGKKLFAMRKKSGAYMSLVSKSKSNIPAKLTISGTQDSVDIAVSLVRNALVEKDTSNVSNY